MFLVVEFIICQCVLSPLDGRRISSIGIGWRACKWGLVLIRNHSLSEVRVTYIDVHLLSLLVSLFLSN